MTKAITDKNVEAVVSILRKRVEKGYENYGCTTERTDLSFLEWIQHLQDELMDAAVYCEKIKQEELKSKDQ